MKSKSKMLLNVIELNEAAGMLLESMIASCKRMHQEMPGNPRAQLLSRIEVIMVVIDPTTNDVVLQFDSDSKTAILHAAASAIHSTLAPAAQHCVTQEELVGKNSN